MPQKRGTAFGGSVPCRQAEKLFVELWVRYKKEQDPHWPADHDGEEVRISGLVFRLMGLRRPA